jgi:hypothetical protein
MGRGKHRGESEAVGGARLKAARGQGAEMCKSANRPEACAKVQRWNEVGTALRAVLEASKGRGVALPRPSWLGGRGEASPLPAGGARERQRAPTGSDTFRMPNEVRPHGALGWHAVPTLPRGK